METLVLGFGLISIAAGVMALVKALYDIEKAIKGLPGHHPPDEEEE